LMTPHQHFCALMDELTKNTNLANKTPKGRWLLKLLNVCLINYTPTQRPI
jgi:hypothetical protein